MRFEYTVKFNCSILTDLEIVERYPMFEELSAQNKHFHNYLCSFLTVEDGFIKLYNLP